ETAARLYQLYLGDLRNFLRLLGDASMLALGIEGIVPLSAERIVHAAALRYARAIERRIGGADLAHLLRIVQGVGEEEFTVADAARASGLSQSAASRLMARLREEDLVIPMRTDGKRVLHRPAGHVSVALGTFLGRPRLSGSAG
ncbi:MAG TPA: MarR family transcriptional regulator, partial [Longimicrobium sp.]|nr:MarR family transcriptional regulator [Longimicrobium sp.]